MVNRHFQIEHYEIKFISRIEDFYSKNDKNRGFASFIDLAEYSQLQGSNWIAGNDHVSDH